MSDISEVPCLRCGAPSSAEWNICSLSSEDYYGVCTTCDVDLNALVLEFFRVPDRDALLAAYRESKS